MDSTTGIVNTDSKENSTIPMSWVFLPLWNPLPFDYGKDLI